MPRISTASVTRSSGSWMSRHGVLREAPQLWFAKLDTPLCRTDLGRDPGVWNVNDRGGFFGHSWSDNTVLVETSALARVAVPLEDLRCATYPDRQQTFANPLPCLIAATANAPLVLSVRAHRENEPADMALLVPLRNGVGAQAVLDTGVLRGPGMQTQGDIVHAALDWRLPEGVLGTQAAVIIELGLSAVLRALAWFSRPLVIRLDVAGLGLHRSDLRALEAAVSQKLQSYKALSGAGGLLLCEMGFVGEYADATMTLAPGQKARVDLVLPVGRPAPSFVEMLQRGAQGRCDPLKLDLRHPGGDWVSVTTGASLCVAMPAGQVGRTGAVIQPDPRSGNGEASKRVHRLAFAPTSEVSGYPQALAEPGDWDLTVTNLGEGPVDLSLVLEDAMPLLPDWQMPRAAIRASRTGEWDPDVIGFACPSFSDPGSRCDALARRADPVPEGVVRRYMEPTQWPLATLSYGAQIQTMVFDRPSPEPRSAQGRNRTRAGALLDLSRLFPRCDHDVLQAACLEQLAKGTPFDLDRSLGTCLESRGE